jgi:hypothetical protein
MRTFSLNPGQEKKLDRWLATRPVMNEGAIGGRYVYTFCITSLGVAVTVQDQCADEEIDLTEYDLW